MISHCENFKLINQGTEWLWWGMQAYLSFGCGRPSSCAKLLLFPGKPWWCLALASLSQITECPYSPKASLSNKLPISPYPCFLGLPTHSLASEMEWEDPLLMTDSPSLTDYPETSTLSSCDASFPYLHFAAHLPGILMLCLETYRKRDPPNPLFPYKNVHSLEMWHLLTPACSHLHLSSPICCSPTAQLNVSGVLCLPVPSSTLLPLFSCDARDWTQVLLPVSQVLCHWVKCLVISPNFLLPLADSFFSPSAMSDLIFHLRSYCHLCPLGT